MSTSPKALAEKAQNIKALLFDVDGVLTDGGIIYDHQGRESKRFNVKDGMIIQYLRKAKILTGVITGRASEVVKYRCDELELDMQFHGIKDKNAIYTQIKADYKLTDDQIAYIGDDINDLAILQQCGLSATPADGHAEVKSRVDWVLQTPGGHGALRELADFILENKGGYDDLLNLPQS